MSIYDGREKKGIHIDYEDDDTILDKIKFFYWKWWPYNLRPSELWYNFKCWAWKRHTTIKPRYLNHQYHDRVEVLLHMNFEILCQFIEKECSPGWVDWEASPEHSAARKEMQDLYDWWIRCHKGREDNWGLLDPEFEELSAVFDHLMDESDGPTRTVPLRKEDGTIYAYEWVSDREDNDKSYDYVMARAKLDDMHFDFLNRQLIRIINCRRWMWT